MIRRRRRDWREDLAEIRDLLRRRADDSDRSSSGKGVEPAPEEGEDRPVVTGD